MKLKNWLLFLALIFLSLATETFPADKLPSNVKKGFDSVQPTEAYRICKILASPQFVGRLAGHEGYTAASKWVAANFREWGLKLISLENGYLQSFPSPYVFVDKAEMSLFPDITSDIARLAFVSAYVWANR